MGTFPKFHRLALAASVAGVVFSSIAAHAAPDDAALRREITAMHWHSGPVETLTASHSKITPGMGFQIVTGAEAKRLRELVDANNLPGIEADALSPDSGNEIVYQFLNEGFVSLEDWANVDPDAMLVEIKKSDVQANQRRRDQGLSELHTIGWIERPSLNRDTNTVSWIIEAADNAGAKTVNAVALKLGRNGFEKVIWITDPSSKGASEGFRSAINSHQFDAGYRYVDHVTTDRAATYGVAGLVAGVLGVKLAKAAGIGFLAVFAKKGAVVLLLPIVAAFTWVRRLFSRKSTA